MIDTYRIRNGFWMGIESFLLLLKHKSLWLYPLILSIIPILVMATISIRCFISWIVIAALLAFFYAAVGYHVMSILKGRRQVDLRTAWQFCLHKWMILFFFIGLVLLCYITIIEWITDFGCVKGALEQQWGFLGLMLAYGITVAKLCFCVLLLFFSFFVLPVVVFEDRRLFNDPQQKPVYKRVFALTRDNVLEMIGGHLSLLLFFVVLFGILFGGPLITGCVNPYVSMLHMYLSFLSIAILWTVYLILQMIMYSRNYEEIEEELDFYEYID